MFFGIVSVNIDVRFKVFCCCCYAIVNLMRRYDQEWSAQIERMAQNRIVKHLLINRRKKVCWSTKMERE